ncbi:hypothetical protein Arth_1887 [Arthrobacter sp. FB24]|nr:hypothetical protein Arth_1887 [Arthrobacter sp. FB24]
MTLSLDGAPDIREQECSCCGATYVVVSHFILKNGHTHAIARSALHHHSGEHEAWIDVIFGRFGDDPVEERVSFGCRVGPIEGSAEPAATVVDAAQPYPDSPAWGHKLSREEGLKHDSVPHFWDVVDWLLSTDPTIHGHVYRRDTTDLPVSPFSAD